MINFLEDLGRGAVLHLAELDEQIELGLKFGRSGGFLLSGGLLPGEGPGQVGGADDRRVGDRSDSLNRGGGNESQVRVLHLEQEGRVQGTLRGREEVIPDEGYGNILASLPGCDAGFHDGFHRGRDEDGFFLFCGGLASALGGLGEADEQAGNEDEDKSGDDEFSGFHGASLGSGSFH